MQVRFAWPGRHQFLSCKATSPTFILNLSLEKFDFPDFQIFDIHDRAHVNRNQIKHCLHQLPWVLIEIIVSSQGPNLTLLDFRHPKLASGACRHSNNMAAV